MASTGLPPHLQNHAPWPDAVLQGFHRVPMNLKSEHEWYGPWNTLLNYIFPMTLPGNHGGFQVAPQHIISSLPPKSEPAIFFLISREGFPCLLLDIKPPNHLRAPACREDAYKQLVKRLRFLYQDDPLTSTHTPFIYGVQAMGPNFMTLKFDCQRGVVVPTPRRHSPRPPNLSGNWDRYPRSWWKHSVMSLEGAAVLMTVANHILDASEVYEAAFPHPLPSGPLLTREAVAALNLDVLDHAQEKNVEWDVTSFDSSNTEQSQESRATEGGNGTAVDV
ncbi:hypothetical protein M422DRAFT_238951 [Sphaerobolus stellatus SS14]|nr:hypothetical protein M422DRAFT_238951 [Sphaerobolus stellatus SS14]